MTTYTIRAKVDQIVTKDIKLVVIAGSEEEAEQKAREALSVFPEAIEVPNIKQILVTKSHYWIPRDIDLSITKQKDKELA